MKLRYFSDLHLEFISENKIEEFIQQIEPNIDEICIIAGDIGNPYQPNYNTFIDFVSKSFKKTFVIAGNHEYYNIGKTIEETNIFLEEYFKNYDTICFLNNNYEYYDNYCFIGTTLWSKITNPFYTINDTVSIPFFDYIKNNRLNMLSVDFLEDTLQNTENCIIITHHVPSIYLIDKKYKTQQMLPYNQCFYCDMDTFIELNKEKIKCWIYGHTHTSSAKLIHNIPFLCNPIGYPNENKNINLNTVIHIGS